MRLCSFALPGVTGGDRWGMEKPGGRRGGFGGLFLSSLPFCGGFHSLGAQRLGLLVH